MKTRDILGAVAVLSLALGPYAAYFAYSAYVGPYDGKMNWTLQADDCNVFFNGWCREMYELPRFGHDYRRY